MQGPRAARAVRACLAGGVRRRVGGMCSCVWAWRGGSRGEKRAPRACAGCGPRYRLAPSPAASVGGGAVCVFVRHTARRRLWGVGAACEEAAGKKGEPGATLHSQWWTTACAAPHVRACVRRAAGVWRASRSHSCLWAGGYQRTNQSQANGAVQGSRGMRLDEARVRREVRLPSAARVRKKNAREAAAHGSTGAEGI